jgi:hypothetical protein
VTNTADAVISEATSTIESFFIGPLRLGHVVSHARVALAPDGTRTQSGDTEVFGAMVGSTAVTFTPAGLRVGAADAPLPDTKPLTERLAEAGITVEIMPRQDLPTGVVAPAIRVTQKQQSGSQVVYLVGGASASGTGETADTSPATAVGAGSAPPATPEAGTSTGPSVIAGSGDDARSPASGYAPTEPVRSPISFIVSDRAGAASGIGAAGPVRSSAPQPAPARPGSQHAVSARRAAAVTALLGTAVDVKPLYGTVIAAGILALGAAVVIRGLRPGGGPR